MLNECALTKIKTAFNNTQETKPKIKGVETMNPKKLKELIKEAGYDTGNYSGRGMMGKFCLGFTSQKSLSNAVIDILQVTAQEANTDEGFDSALFDDVAMALTGALSDTKGYSNVVYFPGIPYSNEEE